MNADAVARTRERLESFASVRAVTRASIGPLSQAQLDFSPRAGAWSLGEIVDHLLLAENLYRGMVADLVGLARAGQPTYRRRTFADVNVAPLHLPDVALAWMSAPLGMMSRLMPDRVIAVLTEYPILPTRRPDIAVPRAGRPSAELRDDLAASLEKTRGLIEVNADLDFDALITEHPVMGRMNVAQVLSILARHERRHQGQMETVRVDSRFPTA